MITNPKRINYGIKIMGIYVMDAGIVLLVFLLAVGLSKIMTLGGGFQALLYIASIALGVFICIRGKSHPTERNYIMLMHMVRMDRGKYHPIEFEEGSDQ